MSKAWSINYDRYVFEISVTKREREHNVRCSFRDIGTHQNAYNSIFRFFNELVWFHNTHVSDPNGIHSQGSHVSLNYSVDNDAYLLSFEQKIFDERQHLALAFYREAECNDSPYYRFLCYYKILEIPYRKNQHRQKVEWIKGQLKNLIGELAATFRNTKIGVLGEQSLDEWLYNDGRHAIAHAHRGEVIRDPNNFNDWDEIKWANTIMQELAKNMIVQKLEVPNTS